MSKPQKQIYKPNSLKQRTHKKKSTKRKKKKKGIEPKKLQEIQLPIEKQNSLCQICKKNPPYYHCKKCQVYYCEKCKQDVHTEKMEAIHKGDIEAIPVSLKNECTDHQKKIRFYCENESKFLCKKCKCDCETKNHTVVPIESMHTYTKKQLDLILLRIEDEEKIHNHNSQGIKNKQKNIIQKFDEISYELIMKFDDLKKKIDDQKSAYLNLIGKFKFIYKKQFDEKITKENQKLSKIRKKKDEINNIQKLNDTFALIKRGRQLINNIPKKDSTPNIHKYLINSNDIKVSEKIREGTIRTVVNGKWLNHTVSVKKIQGNDHIDSNSFLKEADILFNSNHPNLVTLYGLCLDKYWMVMEYCNGGSLYHLMKNNKKNQILRNWKNRIEIALDISYGLQYLHRHGIIHSDLKSTNILLSITLQESGLVQGEVQELNQKIQAKISGYGEPKLIQVSTPKKQESQDNNKLFMGTRRWTAPEILDQKNKTKFYNKQCDIYSLGIIFYELSTLGKIPFENTNKEQQYISKILNGERDEIPKKTPKKIKKLIKKMLSKNIDKRPTINEIVNILDKTYQKYKKNENYDQKVFVKTQINHLQYSESLNTKNNENENKNNNNNINIKKNNQNKNKKNTRRKKKSKTKKLKMPKEEFDPEMNYENLIQSINYNKTVNIQYQNRPEQLGIICGKRVYSTGKHKIKIKIDQFPNNPKHHNFILMGFIKTENRSNLIKNMEWKGTYYFSTYWNYEKKILQSKKCINENGEFSNINYPEKINIKEGDIFCILLNMDKKKIYFKINNENIWRAFKNIPKSVNFFTGFYPGSKITQITLI
ncbi:serine-threonine protein kinase [Anaeramoeba flamelloides]|uniref:Serine-threonine protein kinase n=1 Tax=Anaeramoeba flamelloides TaxID=1746091 RepID=A0ABQ8YLB8_9EUKA|nr:serine-threonine protein kinase [Anaeramoeba flamelloides]